MRARRANGADADVERWVAIPRDYRDLRRRDPGEARRARDETADQLERAFAAGLLVADFDPDRGYALVPRAALPVELVGSGDAPTLATQTA